MLTPPTPPKMKCHYRKYDNFIIAADSENLPVRPFETLSRLFHQFGVFVLSGGGRFLAACGSHHHHRCDQVPGSPAPKAARSLTISRAICLVVKVDAIDEIFTRSIILKEGKKKKKVNLLLAAVPLWYLADFDRVLDECPLMSWKHSNY